MYQAFPPQTISSCASLRARWQQMRRSTRARARARSPSDQRSHATNVDSNSAPDIVDLEQFKYIKDSKGKSAAEEPQKQPAADHEVATTPINTPPKRGRTVPSPKKKSLAVVQVKTDDASSTTTGGGGDVADLVDDESVFEPSPTTTTISTVDESRPWEILKSLGSKGASDSMSVATKGVTKGGRARMPGLEIRCLEDVLPIPSHESVGRALRLLSRGEVHAARAVLSHDSVETTPAFCKQWFVAFKLPIPAMLQPAEVGALSQLALQRIRDAGKRNRSIPCRLMVEKCDKFPDLEGCEFASGSELAAAVGQEVTFSMTEVTEDEWCNGKTMAARLKNEEQCVDGCVVLTSTRSGSADFAVSFFPKLPSGDGAGVFDAGAGSPTEVLYRWVVSERSPKESLRPAVLLVGASREVLRALQPLARSEGSGGWGEGQRLASSPQWGASGGGGGAGGAAGEEGKGLTEAAEEVSFAGTEAEGAAVERGRGSRKRGRGAQGGEDERSVRGQRGGSEGGRQLLVVKGEEENEDQQGGEGGGGVLRQGAGEREWALLPASTAGSELQGRVSRVQQSIRRGFPGLCGRAPLVEACGELLNSEGSGRGSGRGTQALLWALFVSAFEDVSPYVADGAEEREDETAKQASSGNAIEQAEGEGGGDEGGGGAARDVRRSKTTRAATAKPNRGKKARADDEHEMEVDGTQNGSATEPATRSSHSGERSTKKEILTLEQILGLALATKADSGLRVPMELQRRVLRTALRMQATTATFPWRGWTHLKGSVELRLCRDGEEGGEGGAGAGRKSEDLTPWGSSDGAARSQGEAGGRAGSSIVEAVRAGALGLATAGEAELLVVYLRAREMWAGLLQPLARTDTEPALRAWPQSVEDEAGAEEMGDSTRLRALNEEARTVSFDPSVVPNLLLFVQAGLPFPPRSQRQHSLPGLARAFAKLCTGVTQRQDVPLLLERVAAFRGRDVNKNDEDAQVNANSEKQGGGDSSAKAHSDSKEQGRRGSQPKSSKTQRSRNGSKTAAAHRREAASSSDDDEPSANDGGTDASNNFTGSSAEAPVTLYRSAGEVVAQGGVLSPHEEELIAVMHAWSRRLRAEMSRRPPQPPPRRALRRERGTAGRAPSSYEARAAFLMLFGETHHLKLPGGMPVAATIAGTEGREVLVQRLGADDEAEEGEVDGAEADARVGAEAVALFGFIQDDAVREAAENALIARLQASSSEGHEVLLRQPPFGFQWRDWLYRGGYNSNAGDGAAATRVRVKVERVPMDGGSGRKERQGNGKTGEGAGDGGRGGGRLRFEVEGREVAAFDATALLEPCNQPEQICELGPRETAVIRQALYCLDDGEAALAVDPPGLLLALQRMAAAQRRGGAVREGTVPEWVPLVAEGKSKISRQVWRDVLLTLTTRESDFVEVAPVTRDGGAARQAVRPMSEGTVLRILFALEALYPAVLERCGALRWRVAPYGSAFVHMHASLEILARHSSVRSGPGDSVPDAAGLREAVPEVKTELWAHQRDARDRVMEGVRAGKLGFADASAVGAGKTLTALATVCAVARHLAAGGKRRHGSLVLVPVNELVREWVMQAVQHCTGLHVIEQRCTGKLFSVDYQRANPPIDGNSLVVSTLARVREHPFAKAAWDFVVVDECLSVQNDSALQTAEAWRQVEASQCGVLMLSATFFRSSYQKLFYMIRMLRSPLPREQPFLTTTLVEHIVCYVPKNRRRWKLGYEGVPLDKKAAAGYAAILTAFQRKLPAEQDHRKLYVALKQYLALHYEQDLCVQAFAATVAKLQKRGRRPLLFANTDKELSRLLKVVPDLRRLGEKGPGPLAVTVHAAAQGLNLQPGDRLEQMKGRVDRPGQRRDDLELVVLLAANTVEEAEAANIRLCGTFFRHYIAPHSREFEVHAIDASLGSGKIQAAFRKRLLQGAAGEAGVSEAGKRKRSGGKQSKNGGGSDEEDGGQEEEEEEEESGVAAAKAGGGAGSVSSSPAAKKGKGKGGKAAPWVSVDRSLLGKSRKTGQDLSKGSARVLDRAELRRAAEHLCEVDPKLRILIRRIGLSCVPTREASTKELTDKGAFLALVKGVVFQMISVQCGNAIMERMIEACGGAAKFTPEAYLAHSDEAMCGGVNKDGAKNVGLSRSKHGFIKGIAQEFTSGRLSLSQLEHLSDHECCQRLCALKGIGEWTAGVFMLHFLNRPDVMLYGDLTVRMGLRDLYNLAAQLERRAPVETHLADAEDFPDTWTTRDIIDGVAEKWRPYRTVVNHLIWHYKENPDSFYVV